MNTTCKNILLSKVDLNNIKNIIFDEIDESYHGRLLAMAYNSKEIVYQNMISITKLAKLFEKNHNIYECVINKINKIDNIRGYIEVNASYKKGYYYKEENFESRNTNDRSNYNTDDHKYFHLEPDVISENLSTYFLDCNDDIKDILR